MTTEELRDYLVHLRNETGRSQRGAAVKGGLSCGTVCRWEHGDDLGNAARLLTYLESLGVRWSRPGGRPVAIPQRPPEIPA